jgi:hypothetical protein
MNKIKIIYFALIPIILSCVSNSANSKLPYILERMHTDTIYKVSIGDCFEFKENKIPNFGFVLTEITMFSDNEINYSITPIKLDTTLIGIDRFINGKTKVGKINDSSQPEGFSLGLFGFSFLNKKEFENIYKQLNRVGSIKISEKYNHMQSGTVELGIKGILSRLEYWDIRFDKMYDEDIKNIIEK